MTSAEVPCTWWHGRAVWTAITSIPWARDTSVGFSIAAQLHAHSFQWHALILSWKWLQFLNEHTKINLFINQGKKCATWVECAPECNRSKAAYAGLISPVSTDGCVQHSGCVMGWGNWELSCLRQHFQRLFFRMLVPWDVNQCHEVTIPCSNIFWELLV